MKIDIRHNLPCTPERFWQMYWSDTFDAMISEGASFDSTLVDERTEDGILIRTMRFEPHRELPRPVAAVVGSPKLVYEQANHYDASASTIAFKLSPAFMPDKLSSSGVLSIQPSQSGCVMTVTGHVTVRVAFIGRSVEKVVVQEVVSSYDRMVTGARQWLDEHGTRVS